MLFLVWVDQVQDVLVDIINGEHPIKVAAMIFTVRTLDVFLPVSLRVVGNAGSDVLGWNWGFLSCFTGLALGS